MRWSARLTGSLRAVFSDPITRCAAAMLATYRRTVAGARTFAMASTNAAMVSVLAGSARTPRSVHQAA